MMQIWPDWRSIRYILQPQVPPSGSGTREQLSNDRELVPEPSILASGRHALRQTILIARGHLSTQPRECARRQTGDVGIKMKLLVQP